MLSANGAGYDLQKGRHRLPYCSQVLTAQANHSLIYDHFHPDPVIALNCDMKEWKVSVLDCEARLAFRKHTKDGWEPGLPKRQIKSRYLEYGDSKEILTELLEGIEAIKEHFPNPLKIQCFICMSWVVLKEAGDLVKRLGPSLWPGKKDKAPAFIDTTHAFDFSNLEHRDK